MARKRASMRRRRRRSGGVVYRLLSVTVICVCVVAAITLFFRVESVVISGNVRYSRDEILSASGVSSGDNLFLLNKYQVIRRIAQELPYVELEQTHIRRRLPDTLVIEVGESGPPVAWVQQEGVWLMSPKGKLVERLDGPQDHPVVTGCTLVSPAVGSQAELEGGLELRRTGLLALLEALSEQEKLSDTEGIDLSEPEYLTLSYMGRFRVELKYSADFSYKLRTLDAILDSGKIQENMTGTFNMRSEEGKTNFIPDG